jgi:predicted cupin superfamily sugar epimerase
MPTANEIIQKLDLKPLPGEGGFYRETYRSDIPAIPAAQFGIKSQKNRNVCTAIYYMVVPDSFSALHRVKSDELFHFYSGDPVEMIQFDDSGKASHFVLGTDVLKGQTPQVVVQKGMWQATKLVSGGKWALMGTTVAPGFEFEDFELGEREQMISKFPHLRNDIVNYTREQNQAHQ